MFHNVGANCGLYSATVAAEAATGSEVLAFEPNPVMFDRLLTNISLNALSDRIRAEPIALTDSEGTATLAMKSGNFGEASLARDGEGIQVRTAPLLAYACVDRSFDLRVLKIDVEGHEPEVLLPFFASANRSLWPTILLIETEHAAGWFSDLTHAILDLGYEAISSVEGNTLFKLRTA